MSKYAKSQDKRLSLVVVIGFAASHGSTVVAESSIREYRPYGECTKWTSTTRQTTASDGPMEECIAGIPEDNNDVINKHCIQPLPRRNIDHWNAVGVHTALTHLLLEDCEYLVSRTNAQTTAHQSPKNSGTFFPSYPRTTECKGDVPFRRASHRWMNEWISNGEEWESTQRKMKKSGEWLVFTNQHIERHAQSQSSNPLVELFGSRLYPHSHLIFGT